MAESDPAPAMAAAAAPNSCPSPAASLNPQSLPLEKADPQPMKSRIAELEVSQAELMERLVGLRQDMQTWKSKLDTQVRTYKDELLELKKMLNTDLEQLATDFKELKTTLQKQQDDVTDSLKNLGLHDASEQAGEPEDKKSDDNSGRPEAPSSDGAEETSS